MIYIIYLISILFLGIFVKFNCGTSLKEKKQHIFIYVGFVYLIGWLIMGFRGLYVGKDTINYFEIYNHIKDIKFNKIISESDIEPGWGLIAWVNHYLHGNYLTFQLTISGILCELARRFTTKIVFHLPGYHVFTITIIIFFYFFLIGLNISRQIISVLFVGNGLLYLIDRRRTSAYLNLIYALMFHYSSILALPMFIIWNLRNWKYLYMTGIISLFLIFIGMKLILEVVLSMGLYVNYVNPDTTTFQEAGFAKVIWLGIAILSIYIIIRKKYFNSFVRVSALFSIIYVFFNFLSSDVSYIERIGLYFLPFVCVPYVAIGNYIKYNPVKISYFTCVVGLYSVWFLLSSRSDQYVYQISTLL